MRYSVYAAALVLGYLIAGCAFAAGHRTPQPFCAQGFLVKPGEYAGTVAIVFKGGAVRRMPLIVTDSVCLPRAPAPFVPERPMPLVDPTPSAERI